MTQEQNSGTKEIFEDDDLLYLLNEETCTASVIGLSCSADEIIIPKSVVSLTREYKITSIAKGAFSQTKIKRILFSEDSEIEKIEGGAFSLSLIESIEIPSTLIELEDGWCHETSHLEQIFVSPNNRRYLIYDDKMIFGKSNLESEKYEQVVFCFRDVTSVEIPSFIKEILPHSFACCENLTTVEFEENSELEIIREDAFNCSNIESFSVPRNVKKICDGAFIFCANLRIFDIPDDSELTTIENEVFTDTNFQFLSIPPKLINLENGWCCGISELTMVSVSKKNPRYSTYNNQMIIGKSSIESNDYDVLVFCCRNLQTVEIPNFIKIIGPHAFSNSSIKYLKIPPQITRICEDCFCECEQLESIEIPPNSQLRTIESEAFAWSSIESLTFPSSVIELKEKWCYSSNITSIDVDPNNPKYSTFNDAKFIIGKSLIESNDYDVFVFAVRDIKSVIIPNFIKVIDSFAFHECSSLKDFEFQDNSQLQIIDKYALSCSTINKISIPKHVNCIMEYAFSSCSEMKKVDFHKNSELKLIDKFAFSWTSIDSIVIPSHVTFIGKNAFYKCNVLQIIEINENSQLEKQCFEVFFDLLDPLLMVPANFFE